MTLQAIYYFVNFRTQPYTKLSSEENKQILHFQKQIDSLKAIEIERRKPKIYPFNPSFLTDYRASKLGMSIKEIDRLLAHRKAGRYINSASEFQQVTKIKDSLLGVIKPYFKFPDWVVQRNKKQLLIKIKVNQSVVTEPWSLSEVEVSRSKENKQQKSISTKDINKATAQDLKTINGIGEKLSTRIIKYRKILGGFLEKGQLEDVYGLKPEVIEKIFQKFEILSKPNITKINVNTATFKEVLHLPYIDYELTKKIFNYRDEVAEIQDIKELKKIDGFPLEKFDRIALYLSAE